MTLNRQPLDSILVAEKFRSPIATPLITVKKFLPLLVVLGTSSSVFAQYFTDMFTGTTVNSTYWRSASPFSDSSVVQSGGTVALSNHGKLISASSVSNSVDVTLKFRFSGSAYDQFRLVTRTNASSTNSNQEFDNGISVDIRMRSDTGSTAANVAISRSNFPFGGAELIRGTYPIALNQDYTARVVDDGTNVRVYVNDLSTPLVQATDTFRGGNLIGLTNREGAGNGSSISAGSQVRLSAFTINSSTVVTNTVTVPDSSGKLINLSTLGSGGFTMGFVIGGNTAKNVLIRAVGPTLVNFGVGNAATQTSLTLYSGSNVVSANSRWGAAANAAQIANVGGPFALPLGSADSAILLSLNPGSYTAQSTANGAVLLEAYEVP